ncbi:MAG: hypothetical protein QOK05_374 [Chloroflexota bacterium]|jgi:hypothetical protein|nr:hypothetical protein [Chloroflexota bacterium]
MTPAEPGSRRFLAGWARWELPALLGTLVLALVLRFNDFTGAPPITDNGDELDWTWQGLGLITRGVPYGWSNLQVYSNAVPLRVNGEPFNLVHPFLDHPPLFGLLVGGAAWLQGARAFTEVTAQMIRPVPTLLSVVALWLAYLLGRRVLGAPPALVGVLLLATAPAAVVVQRQVEAESLLAPILLGALLLVPREPEGQPRRAAAVGLLVLCAVAPMVKLSGVAVAGGVAVVLLFQGRWRLAGASLLAGMLGTAAFLGYGALFDWQLFTRVIARAETHRYGVMGVYEFIAAPSGPAGANHDLRDGWWLLGWLALLLLVVLRAERRVELLAWPILGYAVVIMLFAEHISYFGWFRVAVYPLVYLLAGWLAWKAVTEAWGMGLLLVVSVGSVTALSPLLARPLQESWSPNPYLLIAALALVVGPALAVPWWSAGRPWITPLARAAGGLALGVTLSANLAASLNLTAIYRSL